MENKGRSASDIENKRLEMIDKLLNSDDFKEKIDNLESLNLNIPEIKFKSTEDD